MKMKKVDYVRAIVKAIEDKGFRLREAQRVLVEAAQYSEADVSNEKANNMAIALFKNVNDESEKVASRFKKEELGAILNYINNMDTKGEFEEKYEIAKEIIKEVKSVEMTEAGEEAIVRSVVEEFTQLTGDDAYVYTINLVTEDPHFMAEHSTKEELEAMLKEFVSCISENNEGEDLDAHDRMIDEMDEIAESIEKRQYIGEINRIMNLKRNRNSQLLVDTLYHTLLDLGFKPSVTANLCIIICRQYWTDATSMMNHTQAKLLYTAIKQKQLQEG